VKKLRNKPLPILVLLTFIIIASVLNTYKIHVPEAKAATTTLKVVSVYNVTEPGTTFKVNITVTDVTNLLRWLLTLEWNTSAIELTTGDPQGIRQIDFSTGRYVYFNIYEGPFLEGVREDENAVFLANAIDKVNGKIDYLSGGYQNPGSPGASGSGIIATINFTCLEVGETTIEITYSALSNINVEAITHESVNGIVTDKPPPVSPIWTELWFQATMIVIVVIVIAAVAVYVVKKRYAKRPAKTKEISYEDIL
jgi:hypothetical protein